MRTIDLTLALILGSSCVAHAADPKDAGAAAKSEAAAVKPETVADSEHADAEFTAKLRKMLDRIDRSLKVLREQIIQNQSAPFLADLYLQLGDLLSQRSNVLYYIQMEQDNKTDLKTLASQKFSPVVKAQKEAIETYQQILKEFPKFNKRAQTMYRLAVALKSIDESAGFVVAAENLIKEFPASKETVQARLILGQHFFDMQFDKEALDQLSRIKDCEYPYERNAARYRLGLLALRQEKHADALKYFEKVATDDELKEDANPSEVSLKEKTAKSNIKREALVDSVRAYTEVFKDKADPVGYYSRVAPSEGLFQETMEKLAFRYIYLKRYNFAITLLRTLSERTADPQKVLNIYQQVLTMIPLRDRLDLPVAEMEFVLDKYNEWATHYQLTPEQAKRTFAFFELQIRELGTHGHDLAKKEKDGPRKTALLGRAREFYRLYLGFFEPGPQTAKIAANLADVYYNEREFLQSGSYYLRTFSGEFGKPGAPADLIQNAILSLQKPADYAFYEQLRVQGLLVKSIQSYMAFDGKKKKDAPLNFALAKAYFEQGYYDIALKRLKNFVQTFPNAREAGDAADLGVYYYNIRKDFKGLSNWTTSLLAMHPNAALAARLNETHGKAVLHQLDESVKTRQGYDELSQGRSYLQTALELKDSSLRSAALEQALARSKAEKDIATFLKTAAAMAKAEPDAQKRSDILASMAEETLGITRFYQTLDLLSKISSNGSLTPAARKSAHEKSVKIAAMLRDPNRLSALLADSSPLGQETQTSLLQQLRSMLEAGVSLPANLQNFIVTHATSDDDLLPVYKARRHLTPSAQSGLVAKLRTQCAGALTSAVCKWARWPTAEKKIQDFAAEAGRTAPDIGKIEGLAGKMNVVLEALKAYENSGDPRLDVNLTQANAAVYREFARFLNRSANANKEVASVLAQKAKESDDAAGKLQSQCTNIASKAALSSAICSGRTVASEETSSTFALRPPGADSSDKDIVDAQKSIFAKRDDWKLYFDLGEKYLAHQDWAHALATGLLGRSSFGSSAEEFNALIGCALASTGQTAEARFYLKSASDLNGHKQECQAQLDRGTGGVR